MPRTIPVIAALTLAMLFPFSAAAEQVGGSSARPTGFAIDVDLAVSSASPLFFYDDVFYAAAAISPQLSLGAQINRFFVGAQVAISFLGVEADDDDDMDSTLWLVQLGPRVDYEIWTARRASLFIGGGIDLLLYRTQNDDFAANGFNVDFYFGGRVWVVEQLSVGLRLGTGVGALFYHWDRPGDDEEVSTIGWNFYGALEFRFVASR